MSEAPVDPVDPGTGFGDLPASVLALVEFQPPEDVLLVLLRAGLPDISFYSLLPEDMPDTCVLIRQVSDIAGWEGEERFFDRFRFTVNTFTRDPDGDAKGALLSEAIRVVIRNAWYENKFLPGLGWVRRTEMAQKPVRRSDYATSTGPVQYADLPVGMYRYEAVYTITVRKPPR